MNMMVSSRLSQSLNTMPLLVVVVAVVTTSLLLPLAVGMNYNGTCDDVQPPWTYLKLKKSQFNDTVFYSSLYRNEDCSSDWGSGTHYVGCGPVLGDETYSAQVCFNCINGTLSASLFDFSESVPDAASATANINCADGCGYTCYKLDKFSIRVGWHSNSQPICEDAPEVCPDVAPPPPPPTTTTSSSSSAVLGFLTILLSSLLSGLVVGASSVL
jgi:hypothetical protein